MVNLDYLHWSLMLVLNCLHAIDIKNKTFDIYKENGAKKNQLLYHQVRFLILF